MSCRSPVHQFNLRCRTILLLAVILGLWPAITHAQSSTTTARTPGTPAGSYKLGDADTVNLFTGNINYNLPLLGVGGRGSAQAGLGIVLEGQWDMQETIENGYLQHQYSFNQPDPLTFVGAVKLDINSFATNQPCGGGNFYYTYRAVLSYVEPDGTEHSLRDRFVHGNEFMTCGGGSQILGQKFTC